jgi:hypothetical protein
MLNPEDRALTVRVEMELAAERSRWTRQWHEEPEAAERPAAPRARLLARLRRQSAS